MSEKKIYCGGKSLQKDKQFGTQEECKKKGQLRLYGNKKIKKNIKKVVKKKRKKIVKDTPVNIKKDKVVTDIPVNVKKDELVKDISGPLKEGEVFTTDIPVPVKKYELFSRSLVLKYLKKKNEMELFKMKYYLATSFVLNTDISKYKRELKFLQHDKRKAKRDNLPQKLKSAEDREEKIHMMLIKLNDKVKIAKQNFKLLEKISQGKNIDIPEKKTRVKKVKKVTKKKI